MKSFKSNHYIGPGIDGEVVHRQAREAAQRRKDPEDSVVHEHAYNITCRGNSHMAYTTDQPTGVPFTLEGGE